MFQEISTFVSVKEQPSGFLCCNRRMFIPWITQLWNQRDSQKLGLLELERTSIVLVPEGFGMCKNHPGPQGGVEGEQRVAEALFCIPWS